MLSAVIVLGGIVIVLVIFMLRERVAPKHEDTNSALLTQGRLKDAQ